MKYVETGIEISDVEVLCLQNDLLDIDDWILKAVAGKINNCKKRMIRDWIPRLMADPDLTSIPSDEDALIQSIVDRDDYMNRQEREDQPRLV